MLVEFGNYLTFENIYFWSNLGLLPFWLMIILIPHARITQIFVNSVIIPLIIGAAYIYILYETILLDEPVIDIFKLYINLDNLYTVFSTESFLLVFWLHFISINIFVGSWMSRDAIKHGISRSKVSFPLILLYLIGPAGIVIYWMMRIFYAKKLGFHD